MANNEHTIDIRIDGMELLVEAQAAITEANRRAEQWRAAALLSTGLLALVLAAMLLGCSGPLDVAPEPEPDACADVAAAEVPLPEGCVDEPCGYDTPLERCTRTYICSSRPGVCVTAWDCACASELAACLDDGAEVPSICEGRRA